MTDKNLSYFKRLPPGAPKTDSAEDDSGLPSAGDGVYQPYARAANKPIYSIHFVTSKREVHSAQYIHLDSNSSFTSDGIALRFAGLRPVSVHIAGRNLWRLYDYIHQHRMQWVMEVAQGRDFVKDGDPVVTSIRITPVGEELRTD